MATDPDVVRHITDGVPWEDERIDDFIDRQARFEREHGFCMWWIGTMSGEHVGLCGPQPVPDGSHIEIGWWVRPRAQGHGYAFEAAEAALRWIWDNTDLTSINAHTVEANEPSWRLMEKLGMTRLGFFAAKDQGRPALDIELLVYRIERGAADRRRGE